MKAGMKLKWGSGIAICALIIASITSCSSSEKKDVSGPNTTLIRYDYSPAQLTEICDSEIKNFQTTLDALAKSTGDLNFQNSFGQLENTAANFTEKISPLTFMSSVSTNAELRTAAQNCETKAEQATIEVFLRKDLYLVMKKAQASLAKTKLAEPEQRLIHETMKDFKLNGLDLPDDKLAKVKDLKKQMTELNTQFHANLNNNTDFAEMNEKELAGVPDSVKSRFTKMENGNYKIPAKSTFYMGFAENASNADARKKMQTIYENREAIKNTELMRKVLTLRQQTAKLLGFKNWADYKTYNKMAKTGDTAWNFLQDLKTKLRKPYMQDYENLLKFKKQLDPNAKQVDPWDTLYLSYQLKKKEYSLDEETLREYFPSDYVVEKMFSIYSRLFGVNFVAMPNANVWHPSVKLFEVRDQSSNKLIAHFYADLYPREGKYHHAAAFPLRNGRLLNGQYVTPIASIVANLTPPAGGKPSLLSHEDVGTLFHEFGHIMHMVLTQAPYASYSGASVAWDFVEAPSQMLENWVWEPEILKMISQHYSTRQPLPDSMIQSLIRSRKFNQAFFTTRQLVLGLFDMTLHRSNKEMDPTETYKQVYRDVTSREPLKETHFPATFGHLMGGYDAGYYGYLWSQVFAYDMYTHFENGKTLSPEVGKKYRVSILEKGNLRPADQLLTEFLGRKPNSKAFFKFLGVK